ncbi:MAG: hypothetical protein ACPGYP_08600 [Solirubrobacterales bacterium]
MLPILALIEARNPGENLATSNVFGGVVVGGLAATIFAIWPTRAGLMFVGTTDDRLGAIAGQNPWNAVPAILAVMLLLLSAYLLGASMDFLLTAAATTNITLGVLTIIDRWIVLPRRMSAEGLRTATSPSDAA